MIRIGVVSGSSQAAGIPGIPTEIKENRRANVPIINEPKMFDSKEHFQTQMKGHEYPGCKEGIEIQDV